MKQVNDLTPAEVLVALYNASKPQGLGFLHFTPDDMRIEEAEELLRAREPETYFDYLKGRVMKIDVAKRPLDTRLYNRDCGEGAAERVLAGAAHEGSEG